MICLPQPLLCVPYCAEKWPSRDELGHYKLFTSLKVLKPKGLRHCFIVPSLMADQAFKFLIQKPLRYECNATASTVLQHARTASVC